MYTVYKCESKTSDKQRGRSHYSDDGEKTLCGIIIAEGWYIVDNTFTGKAQCPECIKRDPHLTFTKPAANKKLPKRITEDEK